MVQGLKAFQIAAAAGVPVVIAVSGPPAVAAVLGGLVAVVEGLQGLNQYQQNWIFYRSTCEALRHEKFLYLATDALEDLRDLARGIYPPLLADKGLATALEAQARRASVAVTIEAENVDRYPQEVESAVYFCTLEALNNVAKYANASRATVRLTKANGLLTFAIIDDGRGFEPGEVIGGTGMQGMADRLDAIGGALEVRSAPGGGTTVTGTIQALGTERAP